jgi:hypothetical protein
MLANVLGGERCFEEQSDAEARAEMSRTTPAEYGMPSFASFQMANTTIRAFSQPLRRSPRIFEQWAHAHAEAFC